MFQVDWGFPVGAIASVNSPGLFAFCARENLKTPALEVHTQSPTPSPAEKLAFQDIERAISATRSKH